MSSLLALANWKRASSGSTEGADGRLDELVVVLVVVLRLLAAEREEVGVELLDGEWRDFLPCLLLLLVCFLPCLSRLLDFLSFLSRLVLVESFNSPNTRDEMAVEEKEEAEREEEEEDRSADKLEAAEGEGMDEEEEEVEKAGETREGEEDDRGATGAEWKAEVEEDERTVTGATGSRRGTAAAGDRGADIVDEARRER